MISFFDSTAYRCLFCLLVWYLLVNNYEIKLESGTFTFNRIFEIFAHILKLHYNLSTGKTFANTNGIKILKSKFNFG